MKVSDLISRLNDYQKVHGDDPIDFLFYEDQSGHPCPLDLELREIHDGYFGNSVKTRRICEIRFDRWKK